MILVMFITFLPPESSDNSNLEVAYRRIKLQEICFEVTNTGDPNKVVSPAIRRLKSSLFNFRSYLAICLTRPQRMPWCDRHSRPRRGLLTSPPWSPHFPALVSPVSAFGLTRPRQRDSPAPCRRRVTYSAKQCEIVLLSGVQMSYCD